jgi:hypothetical protein
MTAKQWRAQAIEFGKAFVKAYSKEDVTTYLHIFVYHYGFFLERYNGLEKFANYALEGKHRVLKQILARGTSGFSHGPSEAARQQLAALVREEANEVRITAEKAAKAAQAAVDDAQAAADAVQTASKPLPWAEEQLPNHESIKGYVVDTKFI